MFKNLNDLDNKNQKSTFISDSDSDSNSNSNSNKEVKKIQMSDDLIKKMDIFYKMLDSISTALNENNIPFYLDCGTLLGCIREGRVLLHDTDIDITIHLSEWENLLKIDYFKYGLFVKRICKGYPNYPAGNLLSICIQNENSDYYCDIYANPAFPLLTTAKMNNKEYPVPKDPGLYLKQLYGNWTVPSGGHADSQYHRNNGLIFSEYKKNWDLRYNIYKCKF
jgi:phosphorylcholine metabolism protein LicD